MADQGHHRNRIHYDPYHLIRVANMALHMLHEAIMNDLKVLVYPFSHEQEKYAVIKSNAQGQTQAANSVAGPVPRDLPNKIMSLLAILKCQVKQSQTVKASSRIPSAEGVPGYIPYPGYSIAMT
ncbi:UNKNOWN [Stylonychia lemnae]|uniref:Uncharacterized protein n=1 Tax=Stylonychia lemnae TaxID=5949 RepID=A0A078AJ28_STYLE|nr:UNKNOWN [Stylonychia lemnae]|eukprot:CDW81896.1 UNKNOWN [Stylonychia lemnae]